MNGLVYGLLLAFSTQSLALIYNKSSIQEIQRHLLSREGVPLIFLFLTVYWKLQLMPFSYYDEDLYLQPVKLYKLLIIQDLMQYVSHRLEHKYHLKCHIPHHKFVHPIATDSFQGSMCDSLMMIIIPLLVSTQVVHANCFTYQVFGALYSLHLFMIHAHYDHPWEKITSKLGICSAKHHRVHHKKRNKNYGHIFTCWDWIFGTLEEQT